MRALLVEKYDESALLEDAVMQQEHLEAVALRESAMRLIRKINLGEIDADRQTQIHNIMLACILGNLQGISDVETIHDNNLDSHDVLTTFLDKVGTWLTRNYNSSPESVVDLLQRDVRTQYSNWYDPEVDLESVPAPETLPVNYEATKRDINNPIDTKDPIKSIYGDAILVSGVLTNAGSSEIPFRVLDMNQNTVVNHLGYTVKVGRFTLHVEENGKLRLPEGVLYPSDITIQGLDAGDYKLHIEHASRIIETQLSIQKKEVEGTLSVQSKRSDGTRTAKITIEALDGVLPQDRDTVSLTVQGEFSSAQVGNHPVQVTEFNLVGTMAHNYQRHRQVKLF